MRVFAVAAVLALILASTGCWTSLTSSLLAPKVYPDVEKLKYSDVIDAPNFLKAMREVGATPEREFTIKPGVTLRIIVGNEDIGGEFMVDPSGTIDFPYVGLITVAEKTIMAMRDELKSRLEKIYEEPRISVNLVSLGEKGTYTGLRAYVLSESGSRTFNLSGSENLLDLIASAVFNESSALDLIAVYKPPKEGRERGTIVICNLMEFLHNGDHRQNIPIEHLDVIFVPTRHNTILEEFVASMGQISSIISGPMQVENGIRYWLRNPRTSIHARSRIEGELYRNPAGSGP